MTAGLGYVAAALLALLAAYAFVRWHAGRDATRYANLVAARAAEGVSAAEFDQEMTLRIAAAEFRRKVSLAVVAEPTRHEEIIAEVAKKEALILAATDKPAAKLFLAWVEGAGLDEILHPAAKEAVWRAVKPAGKRSRSSAALSSALRVQ